MGGFCSVTVRLSQPTVPEARSSPSMGGPGPSLRPLVRVLGGRGLDYYYYFPWQGDALRD